MQKDQQTVNGLVSSRRTFKDVVDPNSGNAFATVEVHINSILYMR